MYINDAIAIWGGLERILVEKANYLADVYGYNINIVTTNQGGHPVPYTLSPQVVFHNLDIMFHHQYLHTGIRRLYMRLKKEILFKKKLKEYIETIKPDIIVTLRMDYLYYLVKVNNSIPLVVESHFSYISYLYEDDRMFHSLHLRYGNMLIKKSSLMLVALTSGDAKNWEKITKNVCVIPNMVHLNETGCYSDCSAKRVIYVGRFSKQKDISSLIRIWIEVHSKHPDWRLDIFGGYGECKDSIVSEITNMNANIRILEPTSNIFKQYIESSMLLLTSIYEPFGLVIPEAMSCGIPVVSFDCPYGPREIIVDGVNGFLVKERNVHVFAERVCQLIESPDLRISMGREGIKTSMNYHSSIIMPMWKNLFEKIVQ